MSQMTFSFHETMKQRRAVYNDPEFDKEIWNMDKLNVDDKYDPVNHPSHYTQGGIECIDAMKASMPHSEFIGYLRGCAFKYLWRFENKGNAKQDLEKAHWYIEKLIDETEEKQ